MYEGKPVTKGKGRFGPFIKWDGLFINIPRAYSFDTINQQECEELIQKKVEKESNRYILNFPELKISVENGRWGPFIKFQKKMLKLIKEGGGKFTSEEAAALTLDDVKKMIEIQVPNAFVKKVTVKKAAVKKAASKKPTVKKVATVRK
jgi:DNA topoisomerase-1